MATLGEDMVDARAGAGVDDGGCFAGVGLESSSAWFFLSRLPGKHIQRLMGLSGEASTLDFYLSIERLEESTDRGGREMF